jgi:UDP:flavonoid glycosyltransferase YjiC (YdhE family)
MRITLIAFGTRGDVTPLVVLGSRLLAAGHRVQLVTHAEFQSFVTRHGIDFHPIAGSYQQFVATPEGRRALGVPRNSPLGLTGLFNPFRDCAEAVFRGSWQACADTDAIVCSPVASIVATLIAQAMDLPLAVASPIPPLGSRYLPAPVFPPLPLGPLYNALTHFLSRVLVRRGASQVFDTWVREAHRVAPRANATVPTLTLVAASPLLVPRPIDWPDTTQITGYWFPPAEAAGAIPPEVRAFVEGGAPPICLGFGSMADDNPEELRAVVLDAVTRLKTRAVVVGGSGGALHGFGGSENICEVPFVDYDWLFRNTSVVVHQGGAGTAAFCLTAGVPQVVVPYCLDHEFWAWRLRTLGVAPPSIKRHRLTASAMANAIRQAIENPSFRSRAKEVAPTISAENGLERAVQLLENHFNRRTAATAGQSL